jgi:hypothetical protein
MSAAPLSPEAARFYSTQSLFSDPGAFAPLYRDLPADPAALAHLVRGLLVHRLEGPRFGVELRPDRLRDDAESRYVDEILRLVAERASAPLTTARVFGNRFVGICRDFALLHCSLLRHAGVPARIRSGFADYFADDGFHVDHVVTEYWDAERGWLLADPQVAEGYAPPFDPMDVPRDRFLVAGKAWQLIRCGEADPKTFGLPMFQPPLLGEWFVAGNIRLDLAFLNKVETLLWDIWGLGAGADGDMTREIYDLYDLAATVSDDEVSFEAARRLFTDNAGLRTPATVTSLAMSGASEVTLRR